MERLHPNLWYSGTGSLVRGGKVPPNKLGDGKAPPKPLVQDHKLGDGKAPPKPLVQDHKLGGGKAPPKPLVQDHKLGGGKWKGSPQTSGTGSQVRG